MPGHAVTATLLGMKESRVRRGIVPAAIDHAHREEIYEPAMCGFGIGEAKFAEILRMAPREREEDPRYRRAPMR